MKRLERDVDFAEFLKVLRRAGRPRYLPFYEHIASPEFIARRLGQPLPDAQRAPGAYWRLYADFWLGLGFDCVPLEIPPPLAVAAARPAHAVSHESESRVMIRPREDFERYPWPSEEAPIDFRPFEIVAEFLPPRVKIVAGVCAGPYEWASTLLGVMGLSLLFYDDPELVADVFARIGRLHIAAVKRLAAYEFVGALRQGDDLGFKTATFLRHEDIRRLIFPIYQRMAEEAHRAGKPFILHSCGNLGDDLYEGLISECRIDAKHSFEDVILPVTEFKKRFGQRLTPLGGLDVDKICRSDPPTLRAYTREMIEKCFGDGHWALGTGNSLTAYMPVENYLIVLEEGMRAV